MAKTIMMLAIAASGLSLAAGTSVGGTSTDAQGISRPSEPSPGQAGKVTRHGTINDATGASPQGVSGDAAPDPVSGSTSGATSRGGK